MRIDRLVCDHGNRWVKCGLAKLPKRIHKFPSYVKELPSYQEVPEATESTIIIEEDDKTYVIGAAAKNMGAAPVYMTNKIYFTALLTKAAIVSIETKERTISVDTVVITVPDHRAPEARNLKEQIEGKHEYVLNGQIREVTIDRVIIVDETFPAFKAAIGGLDGQPPLITVQPSIQKYGVIDFGGGTVLAAQYVVDPSGQVTKNSQKDYIGKNQGTMQLASEVNAYLTPILGRPVSTDDIMDAVEQAHRSPAPHRYILAGSGTDFTEEYNNAFKEWANTQLHKIFTLWSNDMDIMGPVAVIGGSANLFKQFILDMNLSDQYRIPDHPETFSIRALMEGYTR